MTLLDYIKRLWRQNLFLAFWLIFRGLVQTLAGMATASALTMLAARNLTQFLVWTGISLVGYLLFCYGIYQEIYYSQRVIQKLDTAIRSDIGARLANQSYLDFHNQSSQSYVSWLTNDITVINTEGYRNLVDIVSQTASVIFSLIALIHYHYSLGLLALILTIVMFVVPRLFNRPMQDQSLKRTEANERALERFTDVLNGFDELLMFNLKRLVTQRITHASTELAIPVNRYARTTGAMTATVNGVSILCQTVITAATGILFFSHLVPIVALAATQNFAGTIFAGLTGITASVMAMGATKPIFEKFASTPSSETLTTYTTVQFQHELRLEAVAYTYAGSLEPTLNEVSMTFKKGKKYAIVGPSGVGKSTLANIIAAKLTDYRGQILIDNQSYLDLNPLAIRQNVLYVNQAPYLFMTTLRENITLGQAFTDEQLTAAITASGLDDFVQQLPDGLETVVVQDGRNFSGGQRQRIVLARGLIRHREVVILDEATSALDKKTALAIETTLIKNPTLTVIMITHHLLSEVTADLDAVYKL
ncbi:ABC transporter ATP-binding protein [Lacticaseibacillus brantae]|nr:ABC transporter ATP-binding protein [Lacticaseibacillus brantae]